MLSWPMNQGRYIFCEIKWLLVNYQNLERVFKRQKKFQDFVKCKVFHCNNNDKSVKLYFKKKYSDHDLFVLNLIITTFSHFFTN